MIKDETALRIYQAEWIGKNSFPWCSEMGGIPYVYETSFSNLICSDCADEIAGCDIEHIIAVIPYYEWADIGCDKCGAFMPSHYGEVNDD